MDWWFRLRSIRWQWFFQEKKKPVQEYTPFVHNTANAHCRGFEPNGSMVIREKVIYSLNSSRIGLSQPLLWLWVNSSETWISNFNQITTTFVAVIGLFAAVRGVQSSIRRRMVKPFSKWTSFQRAVMKKIQGPQPRSLIPYEKIFLFFL